MSEKEYIVGLHRNVDFESFNNEMISAYGTDYIPQRPIDIANYRPGSERLIHYYLTDEEAEILKNDSRVACVEIPPNQREDIKIIKSLIQESNFNKTTSTGSGFVNWGLRRVNEEDNPYIGSAVTGGYNYTLDGSGVDIIIQDSGIEANHPEFKDQNGISRVQEIDWYTVTGLSGSMPLGHYGDTDGHGTHVAGIAAGLTYGWAKNARIYSIKVDGLDGGEGGIPVTDCFDLIKVWHQNKPIDPQTGVKRPTIVNMSWSYISAFALINGGVYKGTPWSGSTRQPSYGMVGFLYGSFYYFNSRVSSVDIDVQEMIDAGIHVCIAAGNSSQKVDISTGSDYNNYFNSTLYGPQYYHRGGSPHDNEAIVVGNIDTVTIAIEQKAASSNAGPGVDVYAPGTYIVSTMSNINQYTSAEYPDNPSYKIGNLSGTSMASPQVAGLLALHLQINPQDTPAQAKEWVTSTAKLNKISQTVSDSDYVNSRSLLGSANRYLYNPYNLAYGLTITGGN